MFTFIRHNRLKLPYDDYSKLSLDELERLASCEVDPSIQEFTLQDIEGIKRSIVLDADILICSESIRSRETLEFLLDLFGINKEIVVESLINEIAFSPKRLVDGDNEPLKLIRENFVRSLNNEYSGSEQVDDIKNRIEDLKKKYKGRKVFGVSHGFFLGFWKKLDKKNEDSHALDRIEYLEMVNFG